MRQPPRKDPAGKPAASSNRRDFLKGSSVATMLAMMGGTPLVAPRAAAQDAAPKTLSGNRVKVGVIGCGAWGREILNTLAQVPSAEVVTVCDTYSAMLRRAKQAAPGSEGISDYKQILKNPDITAVIIATPSHQHRKLVEESLAAGKHVYCEAPLAHTIEDARAIAQAAKKNPQLYFQPGLSLRSDPQRLFLLPFLRAGAAGRTIKARTQWHKKGSLRRTSPSEERERELNWRLYKASSPGLLGEMAIHQLDNIAWFFNRRPTAVTAFASNILWDDGREVSDSVQAVYEFPNGVHVNSEVTLANSFDADFEMIFGSDAAVMLRGNKAWMFKEVDAPLLGWEVYARKDTFYRETGIALVANATKLKAQGDKPVEDAPFTNTPLFYALEAFIYNSDVVQSAVKDFVELYGADNKDDLMEALAQATGNNKPAANWRDGYEATVIALKGTEAALKKQRVEIPESLFEV